MKKIGAALALVISLGLVAGTVSQYRWWPWIWEFRALAAETYKTAITQQWDLLLVLQSRLDACKAKSDNQNDCNDLQIQEKEREHNIRELERKQEQLRRIEGE